ncbi:flavodoxin [Pontibacterium granulatum]|uniref:flavodoxin n=1 Tax=Pontibacterium granulatum TaxID=2036029 RepID=UPI00249B0E4B|nr:flavodoxin [Pontibacterium granulatum]MDI3323313.1 flavodoxin [Pontibacterium granulatum]
MANIKVLVGSTYGNAQQVAEDCAEQLNGLGHNTVVLAEPKLEEVVADDTEVLLVCTATIGLGEIPNNLMPLYSQLKDQAPQLSEKRYGLISLGDSGYQNFANAGKLMDELLQELQVQRVGETLEIDACETPDPEEAASEWVSAWAAQL